MRATRSILLIALAVAMTGTTADAQEFYSSDYIHSIYNASASGPGRGYGGVMSHDLSDVKWWRQLYGEMAALGVNHTAPLVTYGLRAIYPTQVPDLHRSASWAEVDMDPLRVTLDVSEELGIEVRTAAE